MPVLEDALDRSLLLAAAMDSRGYGRHGHGHAADPAAHRRRCSSPGCSGLCAGAYGLLDGTAPGLLGLPIAGGRGGPVRRGPRRWAAGA